uniref:Ig-like domain-containing protein n=1 Tax=Cyprinodon variegatus TaxID=28743 RepID=A0A3Q2DDU7_CYPVA
VILCFINFLHVKNFFAFLFLDLTSGYNFVVKTANARENVTMKCPRSPSTQSKSLFWVKFSSVKWPEFLGQTITLDYDKVTKTRHLTSKQEEGTFILHIKETQQNDTGLYYCIKVEADLKLIFVNGIFLKINEVSTVTQEQLPDSLRPGESVTLQCSVFFHCKRKNCPTYHRVHWFKAGSDESHPSLIYVDGKSGKDCDGSPEAHTCVYRFSKMVSHSDAGTYYCAVATYEEIKHIFFLYPVLSDYSLVTFLLYLGKFLYGKRRFDFDRSLTDHAVIHFKACSLSYCICPVSQNNSAEGIHSLYSPSQPDDFICVSGGGSGAATTLFIVGMVCC